MKFTRLGWMLAIGVVTTVAALLAIQHYYRKAPRSAYGNSGSLKVNLPKETADGRSEKFASADSQIPAPLESKLASDSAKEIYGVTLSKVVKSIEQTNKDFKDVTFEEVPEDFRLKMRPAENYEVNGHVFHYYSDETDKVLVDMGIQDYGKCTSTVAYNGEEAFAQLLRFEQPMQLYFPSYKTGGRDVFDTQTYEWKGTGTWAPPAGTERYLSLWPAKLDLFAARKLSKGEQISTTLDGQYAATYEVLGCAEIKGHKTIAFEQRIPDCPTEESMASPPFKREVLRRFYLDIQTSMPLRADIRAVSHFTEEHKKNPKSAGIPESGIRHDVIVYQVDL